MALTDKLTAIANAIRAKTGGSSTLTLPQMASAVGTLSGNCKCFTIEVSEKQTALFAVTGEISELAAHFNTATLWAGFLPLSLTDSEPAGEDESCRRFGFASNSPLFTTYKNGADEAQYGIRYASKSGSAANGAYTPNPLNGNSMVMRVSSAGVLSIYADAAKPVPPGSYLVMYGW